MWRYHVQSRCRRFVSSNLAPWSAEAYISEEFTPIKKSSDVGETHACGVNFFTPQVSAGSAYFSLKTGFSICCLTNESAIVNWLLLRAGIRTYPHILLEDLQGIRRRALAVLVHVATDFSIVLTCSGADPHVFLESTQGILRGYLSISVDVTREIAVKTAIGSRPLLMSSFNSSKFTL